MDVKGKQDFLGQHLLLRTRGYSLNSQFKHVAVCKYQISEHVNSGTPPNFSIVCEPGENVADM